MPSYPGRPVPIAENQPPLFGAADMPATTVAQLERGAVPEMPITVREEVMGDPNFIRRFDKALGQLALITRNTSLLTNPERLAEEIDKKGSKYELGLRKNIEYRHELFEGNLDWCVGRIATAQGVETTPKALLIIRQEITSLYSGSAAATERRDARRKELEKEYKKLAGPKAELPKVK